MPHFADCAQDAVTYHRAIEEEEMFRCVECGFSLDANLNASRNIAHLGMSGTNRPSVSGPNVASVDAEDRKVIEAELCYRPTNSFAGS